MNISDKITIARKDEDFIRAHGLKMCDRSICANYGRNNICKNCSQNDNYGNQFEPTAAYAKLSWREKEIDVVTCKSK